MTAPEGRNPRHGAQQQHAVDCRCVPSLMLIVANYNLNKITAFLKLRYSATIFTRYHNLEDKCYGRRICRTASGQRLPHNWNYKDVLLLTVILFMEESRINPELSHFI
jgi:hypothetical protein